MENGQVRFGYWHFAFLGEESFWAAEASECAAEQEAFWEYHDILFERQGGENQGDFSKDKLKELAADLGLDSEAFDQCLDSGKYNELVQSATSQARSIGVTSTPAFIINGTAILGAQPFDVFKGVIDEQLAASE